MKKKSLKEEIINCGRDPEYFIEKYIKIEHPVRGLIPFKLYDYQKQLLKDFRQHRFNIVNKGRQQGISEIVAAYATWLMLFRKHKNVIVMSTKRDVAKNLIRKSKIAVSNLPKWLMITTVKVDNTTTLEFSNGSRIKAVAAAKGSARSEAGSLIILDELAHIDGANQLWVGLKPVVTAGGSVIGISTPNGVGNLFYELCTGALKKENQFFYTKLLWWQNPEHIVDENGNVDLEDDPRRPGKKTSSWFRTETAGFSDKEIAQEYEAEFLASGDTFIASSEIEYMSTSTVMDPQSMEYWDRNLYVWMKPHGNSSYFVVADVARGDGEDYSAAHVFNLTTFEQCAEYYGKVPVDQYAELLINIATKYNNAPLFVENNSVGLACLEHIKMAGYNNLYFSAKSEYKQGLTINTALLLPDPAEYVPGITTTSKNRVLMLQKLEEDFRMRKLTIRSYRLLEELKRFVWVNGKAQAQKGYNDDLVMACAIASWVRATYLRNNFMSEETAKAMLNSISMKRITHDQIDGASKDPDIVRQNRAFAHDKLQMKMPDGAWENIAWLITKG